MGENTGAAYAEVSRKWKSTAKVVLGVEVGDLADYRGWISRSRNGCRSMRSSVSGKQVILAADDYPSSSRAMAFDEVDFSKKYPPFSINDCKDIDSLFRAAGERVAFTGNVVLGNSRYAEASTNIVDCFYVYDCESTTRSKYCGHCAQTVASECIFGSSGAGYCSFTIRSSSTLYTSRAIEASKCDHCSDVYFSHGLVGCRDCMFSFNMKNARYAIGNLKLSAEKYASLKSKLVSEMAQVLLEKKKLPTIFGLVSQSAPDLGPMKAAMKSYPSRPEEKTDIAPVQSAFSETCGVVLGKPRPEIKKFEAWLLDHTRRSENAASCASGRPLLVPDHTDFLSMPRDRLVSEEEGYFLSDRLSISQQDAVGLSMANAAKALSAVAFLSPEWNVGNCRNNPFSRVALDSTDCYRVILPINSKQCGCGFWIRDSEHVFGGNEVRWSGFCINCYRSENLQRCFECDSCHDCTGLYFSHNCENVHDSLFCFNVKNKRYAIGNAEVGREAFLRAKELLLSGINAELDKSGSTARSIFSLAEEKHGK